MSELTHEVILDALHEQTRREWREKIAAIIGATALTQEDGDE